MKRPAPRLASVPSFGGQRLALAVGMPAAQVPQWVTNIPDIKLETIPFVLIHAAMASTPVVSHVIAPLMTDQFDAQDLARELAKLRYRGNMVVVLPSTPRLPRPEIVRNELSQTCPAATITILDPVMH